MSNATLQAPTHTVIPDATHEPVCKTPALEDSLLSGMCKNLCLTASRGDVDIDSLREALQAMKMLKMGTATVAAQVIERMLHTKTNIETVIHDIEKNFPHIDEEDRTARMMLKQLNAETAKRLGTLKSVQ